MCVCYTASGMNDMFIRGCLCRGVWYVGVHGCVVERECRRVYVFHVRRQYQRVCIVGICESVYVCEEKITLRKCACV